jgi:hypothetical protein
MAPPPKYLIERKLIRKFMKEYLPKHPLLPPNYFSGVFDCWRRFGASSPRCKEEELQYDFVSASVIAGPRRINAVPKTVEQDGTESNGDERIEETSLPVKLQRQTQEGFRHQHTEILLKLYGKKCAAIARSQWLLWWGS